MTFSINADDLPRFMACNGSRLLAASVPPTQGDTAARDEGTAAHYMATTAFNNVMTVEEMINRKAPNGVYMTEEMGEHVKNYLDTLTVHAGFANFALRAMEIQTDHENVNGRCDYGAFTNDGNLTIADFKYGWRIVEPEMNWTLISHAIAITNNLPEYPRSITCAIYQPRPYHRDGDFRKWIIGFPELQALRDQLYTALRNPSNQLHTSNFCGKCPANATCPAARLAGMNSIEATETAHNDDMSNNELSIELDNLNRAQDMIKSRLEALEELAKHRIKAGQVVDNYSVEMGLGKTIFKPEITADLLQALTCKDLSVKKLVTPAEAKRQGVNPDFLASITTRPTTGVKLVRISANKKAEKLFKTG